MDFEVEFELNMSSVEAADIALAQGLALSVDNVCQAIVDDAKSTHSFQNQSSDLENSIVWMPVLETSLECEGVVVALEDYASFVEEGTERMEARPFLAPAVQRGEREMRTQVNWAYRECQAVLNRR